MTITERPATASGAGPSTAAATPPRRPRGARGLRGVWGVRGLWGVRVLGGALVLTGALAFAGCTAVRSDLGTASGGCYVDLPAAAGAVHHAGHLLGVRLFSQAALRTLGRGSLYRAVSAHRPKIAQVCLVAYGGTFSATTVEKPVGRASGHLAVVAVSYPGRRVVATLLIAHLPLPFGHGHIGL